MLIPNCVRASTSLTCLTRLLSTKVNRIATSERLDDMLKRTEEWTTASPYESIPCDSKYSLVRGFLPGGKYHKKNLLEIVKLGRQQYGDVFKIQGVFGKRDVVFAFNPEDFEKLFRTEGQWPIRRGFDVFVHYRNVVRRDFYKGAEGLITSQGKEWNDFRSAVNPIMMNPNSIKLYLSKVFDVHSEFIERIKIIRDPSTSEVPETFLDEINRLALESVVVVALDSHLGLINSNRDNPNAQLLFDSLHTFFRLMFELEFTPSIWKIWKTKVYYEVIQALDNITNITESLVNETMEQLEKQTGQSSGHEQSLFEKLLKVDKKIAIVMAMDMMLAGVDTTSSMFAAVLLQIAKNPDKQMKLREEVRSVMPSKESILTEETMRNLPYLRACIKESMRMHPLTTGNFRTTGEDIVLGGYKMPQGTDVILGSELSTRDVKYYARPNEFIPERWLRDTDESECPSARKTNPFLFLPFGFGPRMCVGKRIVDLELEVGLARLVRNFHIQFNYPSENAFTCFLINVPNIPLKFKFVDVDN